MIKPLKVAPTNNMKSIKRQRTNMGPYEIKYISSNVAHEKKKLKKKPTYRFQLVDFRHNFR